MTVSGLCRGRPAPARGPHRFQDCFEYGAVVDVAGGEDDSQGQATTVAGEVDLGGQPAAGATQRLVGRRACRTFQPAVRARPPFRAPAACWWERLMVESIDTVQSTAPTESSCA